MAALANYSFIDAGPLSLMGLERLVERLPADVRAQLRWSPALVRNALRAFLGSDRDETALIQLVRVLTGQFLVIQPAISALAEHPELFRSELEGAWRADAAVLRSSVDDEAADAADWVMRTWKAFLDWSLTTMHATQVELPKLLAEAKADPDFESAMDQPGAPLRAQGLMMAAIEAVRSGATSGLTADLVFRAFDEVVLLHQEMLRAGIRLDPFRDETLAERGARLRRYADHLRGAISDSDSETLEASRLQSLR